MNRQLFSQLTCLTLLLTGVMLHAQPERAFGPIPGYKAHNQNISGQPVIKQSGTVPGSYILKPNKEEQPDFDTTLANNLQRVLEAIYATYPVGGLSAAALVPGKGMWLGVTGYSTLEPLVSISPDMIFPLNGIEHPMLSALVLLLAEDGKLTLDDTIGMYLPDLPVTISGQITIRQLLNWNTGLADPWRDYPEAIADSINSNPDRIWTYDEIINLWVGPPYGEPGIYIDYSNTNILLAYAIIQNVMQASPAELYHKHIFEPLALEHIYGPPEDTVVGPVAHPWLNGLDNWPIYSCNAFLSMTGPNFFSTAEEFIKFLDALFSGQVINSASLAQLLTVIEGWIGLNIWQQMAFNKTVWMYISTGFGLVNIFYYYPTTGFCYTVLCNNDKDYISFWEITQLLFNEYLKTIPVASSTQSGVLYILSSSPNGLLCTAKTNTLDLSTLGPVLFTESYKIKVHPVTGDLWGLFHDYFIGWQLVKFNGETGEAFPRAEISTPEANDYTGMDFAADGTLYLASSDGKIFTVDTASGVGTLLVTSPLTIKCMAIQPGTGALWATARMGSSRNPRIFKINLLNGDTLGIGNAGLTQLLSDIAFDAEGNLFGVISGTPSHLIYLDGSTGKGTEVKAYDTTEIVSLSFSPGAALGIRHEYDTDQSPRCELSQNYPNPFSNTTSISFKISDNDRISLKIYTLDGREVATLVNEEMRPGRYEVTWDAAGFPGGVYFYKLEAGSFAESRKLVLMR
jgi:D-alanyl-D-alanine carboxypeptidase